MFSVIFSQGDIDRFIGEVLSGSKDSAVYYFPIIEKQYPNNPNMLFLKGILETDGEIAMKIFIDLYDKHPTSDYGDDAVMKVAEYYYASGLYVQSAKWLKKMPLYYSRSKHIERAIKLYLNSLIVSGLRDTAVVLSQVFQRQFPNLDVSEKINGLLKEYEGVKQTPNNINSISFIEKTKVNKSLGRYSLQSGAFTLKKNAEEQKMHIINFGFDARVDELVRKTKKLYAVRIGYYDTEKEAKKIGNEIKSKLDLQTIVVTKK